MVKSKTNCKHKFRHIIVIGNSMDKTDKEKYEWICHECTKCHKRAIGGPLE